MVWYGTSSLLLQAQRNYFPSTAKTTSIRRRNYPSTEVISGLALVKACQGKKCSLLFSFFSTFSEHTISFGSKWKTLWRRDSTTTIASSNNAKTPFGMSNKMKGACYLKRNPNKRDIYPTVLRTPHRGWETYRIETEWETLNDGGKKMEWTKTGKIVQVSSSFRCEWNDQGIYFFLLATAAIASTPR